MDKIDYEKVVKFIREEDVKFIRLAFFDVFGTQKNITIMPGQLAKAFQEGIGFDASAIEGFNEEINSDLFLFPDAATLSVLPWRPADGRVARMFCDIRYPDGTLYEKNSRLLLKRAVEKAEKRGFYFDFGAEIEFYLFQLNEEGEPTKKPLDYAGYMDIAPEDKGENIRREICFHLSDMGIQPETSHHSQGPGQNEIDFHYSDALTIADHTSTLKWAIRATAMGYGLHADLSPKPLAGESGNGMHINMSIHAKDGNDYTDAFMAGVLHYIKDITLFLNPSEESYKRFGEKRAPKYLTWSAQNRSQLIRIPASKGENRRIELRSPDPLANPYLAFALLIHAGLAGIDENRKAPEATNKDLYGVDSDACKNLETLPLSLEEAVRLAENSEFVKTVLPENYLEAYKRRRG